MAWTHKNKDKIKITINIDYGTGGGIACLEEELKKRELTLNKIVHQMQQECIKLALVNKQLNKSQRHQTP